MVVISASICNKQGKILVARQFVGINRLKLEEYVANFPKLIESGTSTLRNLGCREAVHACGDRRDPVRVLAD
jgi:hypothetical protein